MAAMCDGRHGPRRASIAKKWSARQDRERPGAAITIPVIRACTTYTLDPDIDHAPAAVVPRPEVRITIAARPIAAGLACETSRTATVQGWTSVCLIRKSR